MATRYPILALFLAVLTLLGAACGKKEDSSSKKKKKSATAAVPAAAQVNPLVLDLTGAAGLAVTEAAAETSLNLQGEAAPAAAAPAAPAADSNLLKINKDGTLVSAFTTAHPKVKVAHVYNSHGTTLLTFKEPLSLSCMEPIIPVPEKYKCFTTAQGYVGGVSIQCVLVYARADGVLNCVDWDIAVLSPIQGEDPAGAPSGCRNPIQFDDEGNVYYLGDLQSGQRVLRKLDSNGTVSNLMNDAWDYIVKPNGDIYYTTSEHYGAPDGIRFLSQTDKKISLVSKDDSRMFSFPDGNVYVAPPEEGKLTQVIDGKASPTPWISSDEASTPKFVSTNHNLCELIDPMMFATPDKKEIGFSSGCEPTVVEYFPEYKEHPLKTQITNSINKANDGTSQLAIVGEDSTGMHKLLNFNVDTLAETDLLPNDDIKVDVVAITPTAILFSGTIVTGSFGLTDGIAPAGSKVSGLIDLKTLKVTPFSTEAVITEIKSL